MKKHLVISERAEVLESALVRAGARPTYTRWNASGSRGFLYTDNHSEKYVMVVVYDNEYMTVVHREGSTVHEIETDLVKVGDDVARKAHEFGWLTGGAPCPG